MHSSISSLSRVQQPAVRSSLSLPRLPCLARILPDPVLRPALRHEIADVAGGEHLGGQGRGWLSAGSLSRRAGINAHFVADAADGGGVVEDDALSLTICGCALKLVPSLGEGFRLHLIRPGFAASRYAGQTIPAARYSFPPSQVI